MNPAAAAPAAAAPSAWDDAALAAALLAVDPAGLGGAALRAAPGPARDRWLALLRALLPEAAPVRRLPPNAPDGRLLGGLDLAATLRAGRPVAERGVLAEADGGVLLIAMAERLPAGTAARLAAAMDAGEVAVERDGLALRLPARFGAVALDEGAAEDERPPAALLDRLAFHLPLDAIPAGELARPAGATTDDTAAARTRLGRVRAGAEVAEALCAAAMALGVASLRAPLLALRAARAAAAMAGRAAVAEGDAALAARLVLAPRATVLPAEPSEEAPPPETPPPDDRADPPEAAEDARRDAEEDRPLEDVVLAAARAAIPAGLLARLMAPGAPARGAARSEGRAGEVRRSVRRGRPAGVRPGLPGAGARLALVETLRAAAPWQRLRRGEGAADPRRVEVRRDDLRVLAFKRRTETTAVFVVDASGSSALNRLAEAKGAVELLLADCYVRRDRVALVAFRGAGAELLLPPTGSLVRAKRLLAALPGGGGTPLADGLDAACALAEAERRRGRTPLVVLMTDGRANLARGGAAAGRARAEEEALDAGRRLRAEARAAALLVDTAPRPGPFAPRLAAEMGAAYLPLPGADPAALSGAVRAVAAGPPGARAP